ncbi:MAG: SDR family NAD(P)-dependent oxidoreductase [Clostridia bacterium]|nr:SDR family NAD(P)-dependent oxidoreductase [Clostridia bacterium]
MSAYTLITGATGGIGKAFAYLCAKDSQNLFLTGRSYEKLLNLSLMLLELNPEIDIKFCPCNLDNQDSRKALYSFIDEKNIKFNRLINVAGVDTQKDFLSYTEEKIVFQTRVNTEAVFSITRAFLDRLTGKKPEIITISSMSGVSAMPQFQIYSATKACLTQFFKALRVELKGKVNVTTVLPGGVYTRDDIKKDILGQGLWGKLSAKQPEFVAEKSLKAVKRNKKILIPGFWNKFLFVFMKIVPENIRLKFINNRWKKQTKDAF